MTRLSSLGVTEVNPDRFRETFLRSDREGPTKAKMAGKKEAKQKAGPSGQTEKNREETGNSTGTKNTSKEDGQRKAQKKQPQAKQEQRPETKARGGLTQRTSKKAGRLSRR